MIPGEYYRYHHKIAYTIHTPAAHECVRLSMYDRYDLRSSSESDLSSLLMRISLSVKEKEKNCVCVPHTNTVRRQSRVRVPRWILCVCVACSKHQGCALLTYTRPFFGSWMYMYITSQNNIKSKVEVRSRK